MERETRCQAVILKDNKILIARHYNTLLHQEYWKLPGGNLNTGEAPEAGVIREVKEETNLDINVDCLIFDSPKREGDGYNRYLTYLCIPVNDNIKIGAEDDSHRIILELVWCSLLDETSWNEHIKEKGFYPSIFDIKNKILSMRS